MSKKKILVNRYPLLGPIENTDWSYPYNWMRLDEFINGVETIPNDSLRSTLLSNGAYYLCRALDGILPEFGATFGGQLLRQSCYIPKTLGSAADVVLAHAHFPWNIADSAVPIVLDTGFMTNEYMGVQSLEDRTSEIRLKKLFAEKATIITVSDHCSAERLRGVMPDHASRIKVLPWFLPSVKSMSLASVDEIQTRLPIRILFVGRDGRRKGLHDLTQAICKVLEEDGTVDGTDIEVHIVTDSKVPPLPDGLHAHVYNDMSHRRVLRLMQDSHIYAMPTRRDSYGLVFIEAMASGCAILADNKDPRPEIVGEGEAGLCVEAGNIEAIAQGLVRLITKDKYRQTLARSAVVRFENRYSPEVISTRIDSITDEAIEREGRG